MNKCQISAVRVRRKKCVFYLVAAVVLLTGIYDRQLVSARSSINSGQACSSRGQIRDFKAQRFICLKVNAKAGSSKGSSLVWVKISSPKSTTKPSYTTTTTTTIKFSTLRSAVYDDIIKRAALARSQPSKAAFEFRIAPTISATRAQEIIQAILWAHIPWENQTTGAGLRVIVVDEKNRGGEDFFRANMPAGGGNCPGNGWGDYVGTKVSAVGTEKVTTLR